MSSRVPLPWRRVGKVGTTWRSRAGWGCWRGGCGRRRRVCSNSRWMRHVLIQLVMPKLSCCEKWNHENNFHKRLGVKIGTMLTPFDISSQKHQKHQFTLNGSLRVISSDVTIGCLFGCLLSSNCRQGTLRMRLWMRMSATWQQIGSWKNCSAHA